jgi:hypothetical protein
MAGELTLSVTADFAALAEALGIERLADRARDGHAA